jgi:adenylate cyclase
VAEGGERKVDTVRRLLARKAAEIIRNDPEEAATAVELGLVDRRWLEDPGNHPISTSKPTEILESFLARSVERKPSLLSTAGLSVVQLLTAHGAQTSGESKVMTVCFTDLEAFTSYTDSHGDKAALDLVKHQHAAAGPVVRRWRGKVVKHLGDGLLCTFANPAEAVRAAVELLDTSPAPLRLRAGLHTGEVMISHDDVVGQVVNIAARVTETAKGNQVVVSAETAELAGDLPGLDFKKLRTRRLKGISDRMELREVVTFPG